MRMPVEKYRTNLDSRPKPVNGYQEPFDALDPVSRGVCQADRHRQLLERKPCRFRTPNHHEHPRGNNRPAGGHPLLFCCGPLVRLPLSRPATTMAITAIGTLLRHVRIQMLCCRPAFCKYRQRLTKTRRIQGQHFPS